MKCANCSATALYEYRITHSRSQFYCGRHLPTFLDARRKAGLLTITPQHTEEVASALDLLTVSLPEAIIEPEPVVVPTPAPKRRKKTKTNEGNS